MNHRLFIVTSLLCICSVSPLLAQHVTPDTEIVEDATDVSSVADGLDTPEVTTTPDAPPAEAQLKTPSEVDVAPVAASKPVKKADTGSHRIWTLDELIQSAYDNAAAMRVEEANQRHAEWQAFRADYAWTPKIQANTLLAPVPADTDPNDLANNLDEIRSFNIGPFIRQTVSLVLPLYTFGRIRTARELAAVGKKNAEIEQGKARRELEFQVRQAYFGLRIAKTLDVMISDGTKLVDEQLVKMEDARDFGDTDFSIKDFRKLQIFQTDLEGRALDNKKIIALAEAGIIYLTDQRIGLDNVPELDTESEPTPLDDYDHYYAIAQANRPEVLQLEQAMEARRLQVKLERASFYPNVFFGANFTFGYSNKNIADQRVFRTENDTRTQVEDLSVAPFSNPYDQLSVGVTLGLRWNLDVAQSYGRLRGAQALEDKTMAQRSQALGAIELEIKKLHLEAAQARERIGILGRRLEAARRWRDQLGLSIESAGADVSDALDPLKAYYEARVLHMQAIVNYELARAALAKGIGVDSLTPAPVTVEAPVEQETTQK